MDHSPFTGAPKRAPAPDDAGRPLGLLVVPDWLDRLSLQQQSVLMLATRGPDGVRKYHPAKVVHCAYRATVLRAAYRGRFLHWGETADTFMSLDVIANEATWVEAVKVFFQHVDELPHHYVAHLAHAAQIIAYRHPDLRFRSAWGHFYLAWCEDLHVTPEIHSEMNARLGDWGAALPRLLAQGFDFPMPRGHKDEFVLSAPATNEPASDVPLRFIYRNHRGDVAERAVRPLRIWFGSTEWHPAPQWLLRAIDLDKGAERDFAIGEIVGVAGSGAQLEAEGGTGA